MKKILGFLVIFFAFSTNAYADDDLNVNQSTKEQKEIEMIVIQAEIEASEETYKELSKYGVLKSGYGYLEDTLEYKKTVQEKIDEKVKKHGIERISENEPGVSTMGAPSTADVDIQTPVIYTSSQGYFIKAGAVWKKNSWNEPAWVKHAPNMGGDDGLGLYFTDSTNIEIENSSFYTVDNYGKTYNSNLYAYKNNTAGVYYKAPDKYYAVSGEYTWDKAYVTIWPTFKGKVNTKVRTHWTHTWSSAQISTVGISNGGINVAITNNAQSWDGQSINGANVVY